MNLPRHIEAELDKLGLPRPAPADPQVPRREGPIWKPTPDNPDPPF